jgi:hypothetical protein
LRRNFLALPLYHMGNDPGSPGSCHRAGNLFRSCFGFRTVWDFGCLFLRGSKKSVKIKSSESITQK